MEENNRGWIWIWLGLTCCVVSFVAAFKSVDEFYYWRSGTKTRAWVTGVVEDETQGPRVGYTVWYDFANPVTGRRMRGSDYIAVGDRSKYVNGDQIAIEYFGDAFLKSRIQGTGSRFWPALFAISAPATIGCTVVAAILAIRKSREDEEALRQSEGEGSDDHESIEEDEP